MPSSRPATIRSNGWRRGCAGRKAEPPTRPGGGSTGCTNGDASRLGSPARRVHKGRMDATIYHNPNCSTSRNALARLREAGANVTVIEYLKTPPTRDELARLYARAGLTP